ncbi:CAAX protease [Rhizobium sp. Root274]|uniref:cytochrome c oxidase assembly protein n=1 Tax=unclassified Rhizobium TaxID=2613769 RepID=UPI000712A047|nr:MULTISPECIES: cytochrome c oxidase assembly protein [unclassified Rhizobium]KQW27192.1 CAAX protease [Rhizobium sp. Root1240]KRD26668.1 CAAX protease [Rhizobium sp. Root274]
MDLNIYCGPPPLPDNLMLQWNFDPVLLSVLAAGFFILLMTSETSRERNAAIAALVVALIAFVSPLCALASALFSVRVLHHILLVAVMAPLIILALPRRRRGSTLLPAQLSFLAHTGLMWLWHAPGPYLFALGSPAAYWLMELSLIGSAVWLWSDILAPGRTVGAALALLLGTTLQMGMLGALLTFARDPLFVAHLETTQPYGMLPLADQQLSGLLMWVPAALPYLLVALLVLSRLFTPKDTERRAVRS